MAFGIFKTRRNGASSEPIKAPDDARLYAIGDIHGRADLLGQLAEKIFEDCQGSGLNIMTVFLGDYIDRGLASAEVVDWLSTRAFPTPFVALKGNHEETLLRALTDPGIIGSWRQYGGLETLVSYGVDVSAVQKGRDFEKASADLNCKLPSHHRKFMEELPTSYSAGGYFFCHAGIKPGIPLRAQKDHDLMWIRDEFLASELHHEKVIVHGHTPVTDVEIKHNRINLDTGAYMSAKLSCLVLEGSQKRLLST
jgi:serine/threonine protein phosphatase 1